MSDGPLPTSDGHHDRADAELVIRSVREGWPVPPASRQAAIVWAEKAIANELDVEMQEKAAKFLLECDKHNLRLADFLDRTRRLDEGGAADRPEEVKRIVLDDGGAA